jgi:hypothetical protein
MMKRILIAGFVVLISACQSSAPVITPTTVIMPTDLITLTPSPSATVEWFPPTSTAEILPTRQPPPTQSVFMELGEVLFRDDFTDSEGWTVPQLDLGEINIGGGEANIIINEPPAFLIGTRAKPALRDFYAEITVSPILCEGKDEYGFLFRVSGRGQYYRFVITCSGEVRLDKIISGGGTILYPLTRSASVPVGAPSVSKIAIMAEADQFHLFINGDYQTSVSDQQFQQGSFGIYARAAGDSAVTVSFSELVIREILEK